MSQFQYFTYDSHYHYFINTFDLGTCANVNAPNQHDLLVSYVLWQGLCYAFGMKYIENPASKKLNSLYNLMKLLQIANINISRFVHRICSYNT